MIVISEDGKGFVEVESWEDLFTRPGFQERVDPKEIDLKDIIGRYRLPPEKYPCALTTCQQPHFRGYIVLLAGGMETNIGQVCGLRRFGVHWTDMQRRFKRLLNEAQRREVIQATQHRVAPVRDDVRSIRAGEWGADVTFQRMHRQFSILFDERTQKKLVARARAQNNIVNRVTRRSEQEIKDARIMGDRSEFSTEYVFTIAGIGAVTSYRRMRTLLNVRLGSELDRFENLDVNGLDYVELRHWSKWSEQIDSNLRDAKGKLEDCIRFLQTDNINRINSNKGLL